MGTGEFTLHRSPLSERLEQARIRLLTWQLFHHLCKVHIVHHFTKSQFARKIGRENESKTSLAHEQRRYPFIYTAVIDEINRVTFVLFLVIYCNNCVTYEPFQILLSPSNLYLLHLPSKLYTKISDKSRGMLYVYLTIIPRARICSAESIAIDSEAMGARGIIFLVKSN